MIPIINCLKIGKFAWSKGPLKTFKEIKKSDKLFVLQLLDFSKVFEIESDTFHVGI